MQKTNGQRTYGPFALANVSLSGNDLAEATPCKIKAVQMESLTIPKIAAFGGATGLKEYGFFALTWQLAVGTRSGLGEIM